MHQKLIISIVTLIILFITIVVATLKAMALRWDSEEEKFSFLINKLNFSPSYPLLAYYLVSWFPRAACDNY